MRWVADRSGRFERRPHFQAGELDAECERVLTAFLRRKYGNALYPVATHDLCSLLESLCEDVDFFADLSDEGEGVEGVTYFDQAGGHPRVRIAALLALQPRLENRLRTTLTHELGHVVLHAFLWQLEPRALTKSALAAASPRCRREAIVRAPAVDWMEWQAGYACGAFLMPRSALDDLVATLSPGLAPLPIPDSGGAANELVRQVERRFQVSAEAARIRLLQAGYLTPGGRVYSVSRRRDWFRAPGGRPGHRTTG